MSHELKTPLANIREGTELLMEGAVGSLNGEQREVAGILRDNSLRLQRLIENLLSYSEWQAKRSDLEVGEIRLLAAREVGDRDLPVAAQCAQPATRPAGAGSHADRGPRETAADSRQPDLERREVHAGRRHDHVARGVRRCGQEPRAGRGRHRAWDPAGRTRRGFSRRSTRAPRRRVGWCEARASGCPWCRNSCSRTAAASRSSTANFRALISACGCPLPPRRPKAGEVWGEDTGHA